MRLVDGTLNESIPEVRTSPEPVTSLDPHSLGAGVTGGSLSQLLRYEPPSFFDPLASVRFAGSFISATADPTRLSEILASAMPIAELARAFSVARDEDFGGGDESSFLRTLGELLNTSGRAAVEGLDWVLRTKVADPETSGEVLRWLGTVEHPESRDERRKLLEKMLESESSRRRYAATLGLAALDDAAALPALNAALRADEPNPKIRRTIERVIQQLSR
jgi:HEAT repeat protein